MPPESTSSENSKNLLLLLSTFVIAVCGLVYELLAGTISSYLLGDSVYQFSIVIGIFMASMGLGSFLSRHIDRRLAEFFVAIQIAVGLTGGLSAVVLFYAFSHLDNYPAILILVSTCIGMLIGFEIPIVIRILREYRNLRINISNVLTVDYVGALFAAVLFPMVLVPQLGLLRTALLFGLLNLLVAALGLYAFRDRLARTGPLAAAAILCATVLAAGFYHARTLTGFFESRLYSEEIIYSESTPYQRIVITRYKDIVSLFINGGLQFNTADEYRYHESLVHPAMNLVRRRGAVLILGGGDGMALREVLRYPDVTTATVVDLDPVMTRLFKDNALLKSLNSEAFHDPRVQVVNEDAWKFVEQDPKRYDIIIIDLPDPHDITLSKLYSKGFYTLVARRLSAGGVVVTQATSPYYAREAFWCIRNTLGSVASPYELDTGLHIRAYHAYVPSFGEWGFVMASPRPIRWDGIELPIPLRYLTGEILSAMTHFPADMSRLDTEVNTIQTHKLAYYYERGWSRWYR